MSSALHTQTQTLAYFVYDTLYLDVCISNFSTNNDKRSWHFYQHNIRKCEAIPKLKKLKFTITIHNFCPNLVELHETITSLLVMNYEFVYAFFYLYFRKKLQEIQFK